MRAKKRLYYQNPCLHILLFVHGRILISFKAEITQQMSQKDINFNDLPNEKIHNHALLNGVSIKCRYCLETEFVLLPSLQLFLRKKKNQNIDLYFVETVCTQAICIPCQFYPYLIFFPRAKHKLRYSLCIQYGL